MTLPPECLRVDGSRPSTASPEGGWLDLFRLSAPYVAMFQRCTMVLHLPGYLLEEGHEGELAGLLEDVRLCALLGVQPLLVASPERRVLRRLQRRRGAAAVGNSLEVDAEALKLLKQEAGALCAEVEMALNRLSSGDDAVTVYSSSQLFSTLPRRDSTSGPLVGRVHELATGNIERWLAAGSIVLLTSLGTGPAEGLRYVPSEEVALEAARQLGASKLIFFTQGQNLIDARRGTVVPALQLRDARAFVEHTARQRQLEGADEGREVGIVRYLEILVQALDAGVRRGHLIDPRQGALLQELYTSDGSGLLVSQDLYDGIGLATSDEVPTIMDLSEPLVKRGLLKRRSALEVRAACNLRQMFVWKREGLATGCALVQRYADSPEWAEMGCFVVAPHCRGKGHGTVLLSYVERVAKLAGIKRLFLLTTQTMQWFVEKGFRLGRLQDLPLEKQASYDSSRSSRIYVKQLDDISTEEQERFTLVEVDTLS